MSNKIRKIRASARAYDSCKTVGSTMDGKDVTDKGVPIFRGYWIWWCEEHGRPLAWCEKENMSERLDDLYGKVDPLREMASLIGTALRGTPHDDTCETQGGPGRMCDCGVTLAKETAKKMAKVLWDMRRKE